MRILQIAIQPTGGGAEKVASLLHSGFRNGHDARIVYLFGPDNSESADSIVLNLPRLQPLTSLIGVIKLLIYVTRFRPHVTIIHCEPSVVIASLTPHLGSVFLVEHQPFKWQGVRAVVLKATHRLLKLRGSRTIHLRKSRKVLSHDLYIPNPVDIEGVTLQQTPRSSDFHLVFIGRLDYDKGYDRLSEVCVQSKESQLNIFGEGPMKSIVTFSGIKTYHHGFVLDVWNKLPSNPLLLVTSRWEGDGLVILEALARRIPILVLTFDDISELPIPVESLCDSEHEMSEKIRGIRLGRVSLQSLVNPSALNQIKETRSPSIIVNEYLAAFKESVNERN
jgi:glycosyltransferase involved in cell wall biosynthesis